MRDSETARQIVDQDAKLHSRPAFFEYWYLVFDGVVLLKPPGNATSQYRKEVVLFEGAKQAEVRCFAHLQHLT